jgi:hypothetical protein
MKTDRRLHAFRRLAVVWGLLPAMAWSVETTPADAVVPLGPGISVNTSKREAYLDATVCLRRGILEYVICRKHTFEHEAIFATEAKPSLLHTALLLIAGEPYAYSPTDDWPAQVREHPASVLDIEVEFDVGGTSQRHRLGQFARNRERQDGLVSDRWAFAGSVFYERDGKEYYAADSTGGVIGLTAKGASVVQYAEKAGVPYQGDDQGLECNEDALPPAGTTVRVIFRVHAAATPAAPPASAVAQESTNLSGKP